MTNIFKSNIWPVSNFLYKNIDKFFDENNIDPECDKDGKFHAQNLKTKKHF